MQRKVFRIEQMFPGGHAAAAEPRHAVKGFKSLRASAEHHDSNDSTVQDLERELALVQDIIARNKRELGRLINDGKERRMPRAAGELGAAVDGMEKATDKILKSAEVVDESAKALTASLKDDYKRGLVHDIQEHVVRIYEACNFQDLAGQRIGNVIDMLNAVEEQVAGMLKRCNGSGAKALPAVKPAERELLNGPKLDGDSGHANQHDIDKMFG